jgi:hypothetical protein
MNLGLVGHTQLQDLQVESKIGRDSSSNNSGQAQDHYHRFHSLQQQGRDARQLLRLNQLLYRHNLKLHHHEPPHNSNNEHLRKSTLGQHYLPAANKADHQILPNRKYLQNLLQQHKNELEQFPEANGNLVIHRPSHTPLSAGRL